MAERCNFVVGQRVVCVHAGDTNILGEPEIIEGKIYTVAAVLIDDDEPCVKLAEPTIPLSGGYRARDVPFLAWRFRALAERQTDISVFTEILRKVNEGAPVDAFADCSAWC